MNSLPLSGVCAQGFEPVRNTFAEIFTDGSERGASLAILIDGEVMIDLVGGYADRAQSQPMTSESLIPVFSCSKAVSSLVIAKAVSEGKLDYEQSVASLWPEFAANGKEAVTVGEALSHQAGLCAIPDDWAAEDWFDWDKTCARLAAMKPLWPLGEGSGYHPVSWGYIAGEIIIRATGRTIGTILREDLCAPNKIDFWIGLPDSEHSRVAQTSKPTRMPNFGQLNEFQQLAFMKPWSSPGRRGGAAWRRMEIPSANGHGTARAMAELISIYAQSGHLDTALMVDETTLPMATKKRICGQDRVLPHELCFGAGLICNAPGKLVYGPGLRTIGHTGFGGSCLFADPDTKVSFGFATAKQDAELVRDDRVRRLIAALYDCL
ncbi:MAG: esterase [Robiginitomaculum sp.]|nr:MAG: esterase [Robiginitomaculum sp.]